MSMKKIFKKVINSIKSNKEMLTVGLIVSLVGPVLASSIMFIVG